MLDTNPGVARITDGDREIYRRDGVVCLRNVVAREVAGKLLAQYDRLLAAEGTDACRKVPDDFGTYIQTPKIPALVGGLIGAASVGYFWKQMFAKEITDAKSTPWHHDAAGWPLRGEHIVGVWIALTPVERDNGLECIAGSHTFPQLYWAATANGRALPPPPDRPRCPDFDQRRDDPTLTFLSWTMDPGDALFIHPRTLHSSCGNRTGARRRVALATWWHGDDLVWDPRPECEPFPPGIDPAAVVPGARPEGPSIPILWRREG